MLAKKPERSRLLVGALISAVLLGVFGWGLLNRQYIVDQWVVWNFKPDAVVVALEDNIALSDKGAFYFYAAQPVLTGAEQFNEICPRQEKDSPILGCYTENKIAIFDITNPKLEGIEEVTAAHEMLHVVWERTGSGERERIGGLLRAAYGQVMNDQLKQRMEYYERTQPGEFENELHSILATEIRSLSPELEAYYAQYFADRAKVVGYYEQYDGVFRELTSRASTLFSEMETLAGSITARSDAYNAAVAVLSSDISTFNTNADKSNFSSLAEFYRQRSALVTRTTNLENERASINGDIALYNEKYKEYELISVQLEALSKSIDSISDLAPGPAL